MNNRGKFIVIEGIEGAGKTSSIEQVATTLQYQGIDNLVFTREPGGTPIAEYLRTIITDGVKDEKITNHTELLVIYAARMQLVETIINPSLERGAWVISDRHDLSSQAYQGGGRGINKRLLKTLSNMVTKNCYPDLTLYLDLPPEIGIARVKQRSNLDIIEKESLFFFKKIRNRYKMLAKNNSSIVTINANQPLNKVKTEINLFLENWLKIGVMK